jgi:hypothetical protein
VPFDKGSGTTVPPSAWVSVACVSVLLLFAVGPLGFSLQEKSRLIELLCVRVLF